MWLFAAASLWRRRPHTMTVLPRLTNTCAAAKPIPVAPPVIRTVFPDTSIEDRPPQCVHLGTITKRDGKYRFVVARSTPVRGFKPTRPVAKPDGLQRARNDT